MIVDPNLKSSAITNYKGCEIEVVTDLNDVIYFRQRDIADVLGITRNALIGSVRDRIGSKTTVYFMTKYSDDSWRGNDLYYHTGFLSKHHLIELMQKRKSKASKLLLAWVSDFIKGVGE